MLQWLKHSAWAWLLLCVTTPGHADTAYVTDTVTVAIFATESLKGEPIERLTSGSLVDVLQTLGAVVEVKTGSGNTGWLRSTFLTTNLPASIQLENAEHEISKLNTELKTAKDKITSLEGSASKAAKDVGWMKAEMEKARKQVKSLESKLKSQNAQVAEVNQQTESMAALTAEKEALEQQLAATLLINSNPEIVAEGTDTSSSPWGIITGILISLGIGFAAGYVWVDHRVRKRFGGIRVY